MMHNTVRTCLIIAQLGLAACSPKMAMDEASAPAAVIMEEPAPLERKGSCVATDMDDGIGGTGCPTPVN